MVNASSSAWVGCSWVPSPALTTLPRIQLASRCGAPEALCRQMTAVGAHRLEGQRGVLQALALGDARPLGGEVDHVGRQPLGGDLEAGPGAGGVLEEEVDHRAAAQRRQLLDGAVADERHLLGGVEHQHGFVAAEVRGGQQMPVHHAPLCSMTTPSRRRPRPAAPGRSRPGWSGGSCRRSRPGSAARGGRGRPARRAGPRAAGRGRRGRRARPARCARRRGRRRRAPRPCRRRVPGSSVRPTGRMPRRRRSSRYIVVSSEPTGTARPRTRRSCRPAAGRARRPGSGCRAGRRRGRHRCAPAPGGRCGRGCGRRQRRSRHRDGRPLGPRRSGGARAQGSIRLSPSFPASPDGSLKEWSA